MIVTKNIEWVEDATKIHSSFGYIDEEHLFTITDVDTNDNHSLWFVPFAEAKGKYINIEINKDIDLLKIKAWEFINKWVMGLLEIVED